MNSLKNRLVESLDNKKFSKGDTVRIESKWLDDGESPDVDYVVIEPRGDRTLIQIKNSKLSIPPQNVVKNNMIYKVKK